MKNLRILFTILSAICIAIAIPVAAFADFTGLLVCAFLALLFFWLMLLCKERQKDEPPTQEETPEEEQTNEKKK